MSKLFAAKCIDGLVANRAHLPKLAESSPSIVTPLNFRRSVTRRRPRSPKQALKGRKTIRQTVIDRGLIGDKLSSRNWTNASTLAMAKVKDGD